MAYFNDKANVKTGVNARSNFNLSQHVITTQDISRLQVIFKREMIPGDKFTVKPSSFHRLAPLPVPTYGNIKNVTRAFFVPCRILMNGFEQVITQTNLQTAQGPISPNIPQFTQDCVVGYFSTLSYGLAEEFSGTDRTCDFKNNNKYYRFTYKGKLIYNLLISLGYRFNWTMEDKTPLSLLPLLAYGRLYLDWYMPTQYEPQDPLHAFFTDPNIRLTTAAQFAKLMESFRYFEMLEKDFYTCAWPTPSGPRGLQLINLTNTNFGTGTDSEPLSIANFGYPLIASEDGNGIDTLTQYGLNTLNALQNFVNRDMIAGNRYIEQMFARYGVQVPDAWLRRAEYLGSHSEPVQISDVMATAGTQDAQVGDYAGKGISYSDSTFSYEAKEFGYFIVINCLIAETGYYQGRDKENLHLDPFDFFTPEFDQLGAAPIRNDELFTGFIDSNEYIAGRNHGGKPDGVFGFAEQYYEYKNSRDYLLGDFAMPSRQQNADSYHLFRHLSTPNVNNPIALNLGFMAGDPAAINNNFNRIFQDMGNYADHFISEHFISVNASRPMHGRAESLVTEGGRELEMSFNGYQL